MHNPISRGLSNHPTNKALHLTTRASAICESYSAIWGLVVVTGWLAYHSGGFKKYWARLHQILCVHVT